MEILQYSEADTGQAFANTDLSVDGLIYPCRADILLMYDLIVTYETYGLRQAMSSYYPQFSLHHNEDYPQSNEIIENYVAVRDGKMDLAPVEVVVTGPYAKAYLPPDYDLPTHRTPFDFSVINGMEQVAIAKALKRTVVNCEVYPAMGRVIPDVTTYLYDYGYAPERLFREYMPAWEPPDLYPSSLRGLRDLVVQFLRQRREAVYRALPSDLPLIGLCGQRNTDERLSVYQFERWLQPDSSVLEIGAGAGSITLELSRHARTVTALESNPQNYIVLTFLVHELYLSDSVRSFNSSIDDYLSLRGLGEGYDAVVSFAGHLDSAMSFEEYARQISSLVRPHGVAMIESGPRSDADFDWAYKINLLTNYGLWLVDTHKYSDESDVQREVSWFVKHG